MDRNKMLNKAVLGLFRQKCSTFLSVIYCGMKVVWDDDIPTACVDGVTFRINEKWYADMSDNMRVTVLSHELWHVALFHCDPMRAKGKNPRRWNEACDHAINLMLKEHGYEFSISHLSDYRFSNMSAEQIYQVLEMENENPFLPFGEDFVPTGSQGDSDEEAVVEALKVQGLVVKAAVVAQMDSKDYGDLPGSLLETIERILRPKLPWDIILQKFLTEVSTQGYTWSRPNRRYQDMYLPSRSGEEGLKHIGWAFDVSLSMTEKQISAFIDQICHVREMFQPKEMTLMTFDDIIQDVYKVNEDFQLNSLTFTGRGGTNTDEVMQYVQEHKLDAIVIFTDMYIPDPIDPGKPVLWVCMDNPEGHAPFGQVIHLDTRREM